MRTFLFAAAVLMATAAYGQRQAPQFVENQVNDKIETTMSENQIGTRRDGRSAGLSERMRHVLHRHG